MDARAIAADIRLRLGERADDPVQVLAEIERVVAERPACARVRVAIESESLRLRARGRAA